MAGLFVVVGTPVCAPGLIVCFAPKSEPEALDEELDPRFVEACRDLARVEYLVDVLCTGDEREKREVVKIVTSERRLKTIPDFSA